MFATLEVPSRMRRRLPFPRRIPRRRMLPLGCAAFFAAHPGAIIHVKAQQGALDIAKALV